MAGHRDPEGEVESAEFDGPTLDDAPTVAVARPPAAARVAPHTDDAPPTIAVPRPGLATPLVAPSTDDAPPTVALSLLDVPHAEEPITLPDGDLASSLASSLVSSCDSDPDPALPPALEQPLPSAMRRPGPAPFSPPSPLLTPSPILHEGLAEADAFVPREPVVSGLELVRPSPSRNPLASSSPTPPSTPVPPAPIVRLESLDPPLPPLLSPSKPPSTPRALVGPLDPPLPPLLSPPSPHRQGVSSRTGADAPDAAVSRWSSMTSSRPALAIVAVSVVIVVIVAVALPVDADAPPAPPSATVVPTAPLPITKASEFARLAATIRSRPGDAAARDALLARARLHAEAGEWIRAREDLTRLLNRSDVAPIRTEAETLLQQVEDGRRAAARTR